jgi:WD40 repeat protein
MSDAMSAPLLVLPNETLDQILAALDVRSLGAATRSCRRLRSVGERVLQRWESAGMPARALWIEPLDGASLCPFEGLLAVGGRGAIILLDSEGRVARTVEQQDWSLTLNVVKFDGGLAVGWKDKSVRLLDRDWRLSATLEGHRSSVASLAAIGDLLASGSEDATIKLWDRRGSCVRTLEGHSWGVTSLLAFEGLLASGSGDKTVKLWDAASGACVRTLTGHASSVNCLAAFAGRLVSGSSDGTVRWWTRSGECAKVLAGHFTELCSLASSEELLFSACWTSIRVWSVEGERLRTISSAPPFYFPKLCFWRGALVVARQDGVRMWRGA